MTSGGSADRNGRDRRPAAGDLSSVFGAAAAALSRRRIRSRGPRRVQEVEEQIADADEPAAAESDPDEPEIMEDDVQDAKSGRAPGRFSRRSEAPAPRRRFGVVTVRDRRYVDLLLLAAAATGPANGHEFVDLVRERSDGTFVLSLGTVVHQLHRLAGNRLMQVTESRRVHRYSLTPLGERVLATRRREWEAFCLGVDGVLDAADDLDHRAAGRGPA